ncbi:hypothetical protein, partial [Mesorhizobium sp. ES1-4]|uniref:hypothetical protein n=1 Tax=Mesorhizobium sp. ES1-4 TaxID=2876627 RepID=UPI001CC9EF6D
RAKSDRGGRFATNLARQKRALEVDFDAVTHRSGAGLRKPNGQDVQVTRVDKMRIVLGGWPSPQPWMVPISTPAVGHLNEPQFCPDPAWRLSVR